MTETSPAIRKARFEKLIAFHEWLLNHEPERFNLDAWMDFGDNPESLGRTLEENLRRDAERLRKLEFLEEPHTCGSQACLVGHIPVIFPEHLQYRGESIYITNTRELLVTAATTRCSQDHSKLINPTVWLSEFFGGGPDDWQSIIYAAGYPALVDRCEVLKLVIERLKSLFYNVFALTYQAPTRVWTELQT